MWWFCARLRLVAALRRAWVVQAAVQGGEWEDQRSGAGKKRVFAVMTRAAGPRSTNWGQTGVENGRGKASCSCEELDGVEEMKKARD